MISRSTVSFVLTTALGLTAMQSAWADPCGMVPPARIPVEFADTALQRTGLQTTYAFYKDGMETMVLHPGFRGKVEEFGMLIPFPSAPAIRKVSDDTFAHLEAAVSPPDVRVHLYTPRPRVFNFASAPMADSEVRAMSTKSKAKKLSINEVKVVNQEAVGMYEVAVLAAGSAKALKGWMQDHGFQYPDGMEDTVEEYVASEWVFAAVKARVGKKSDVAPRPGMRKVKTGLPEGASFDGHVQAMGFRFPVDAPVIPMRLSVFNGDESHNLVYFVSDEPVRIKGLDAGLVRRQLSGVELYNNLVKPLPLVVTGGSESQIPKSRRADVDNLRNPERYNGVAKALLASDLYASRLETYSLEFEEQEKELLRISESFGLRGKEIDALHSEVSDRAVDAAEEIALSDLRDMTLTVFDGTFPQSYLADFNLTFTPYEMAEERNTLAHYSRKKPGPSLSIAIEASNWSVPW